MPFLRFSVLFLLILSSCASKSKIKPDEDAFLSIDSFADDIPFLPVDVPTVSCKMDASCTHGSCAPGETCYRAKKFIKYCAPSCAISAPGETNCSTPNHYRVANLYNPDGTLNYVCVPRVDCTSTDFSNCPPGTYCFPDWNGRLCAFPGPRDLYEECLTYTSDDVASACKYPYHCLPVSNETDIGICRRGCDTYPGGPNKYPCPKDQECTNFAFLLSIDMYYCCPKGTYCQTRKPRYND